MTTQKAYDSLTVGGAHPSLPRAVKVLLVARFVNRLGAFSMPFLVAVLVEDHGASVLLAGTVVGAFGLATIPSRLLGGRLATMWGSKRTVMVGLAGTAMAQLTIAGAQSLPVALLGAVLLGLTFEIYEPASQGLIADVTPDALLSRAYGLFGATLAGAALVAGLIAAAVGRAGLSWLFIIDAASAGACMLIVAALLPATPARKQAVDHHGKSRSPWRDRRLWLLMGTGTSFATIYMLIPMALPLALLTLDRPASDAGLLEALSALVILAAQPLLRGAGPMNARLVTGYVLIAAGLGLAGTFQSLGGYALAIVVISVGDVLLLGYSYTLIARIAPTQSKAAYFACYGITWGVALTVGPPLMGHLMSHGVSALWFTCGAIMFMTGLAQLAVARRLALPSTVP